jgi:predicted transcriptional regulator
MSPQGVLKHLAVLTRSGLLSEFTIPHAKHLGVRKLYASGRYSAGDYSRQDLTVVRVGEFTAREKREGNDKKAILQSVAEDLLVQGRLIRDQTRRLERAINEHLETQASLKNELARLSLGEEDRLILQVLFAEETSEDAVRALKEDMNCGDPEEAISSALDKLRNTRREK